MKKIFIVLALVAMVFATGCHKENNGDDNGGGNGGGGSDPTVTTYTVTFNANGGTGTMRQQTFTEGETKALMANAFTYQYHTFVNWNTVADGTGNAYIDGQEITVTANITLYAQWSNKVNGHEWVDLGLPSGTLWATCNVGAGVPEDYGDYFAWGETQPQASNAYSWISYIYTNYADGFNNKLTKYCNNASCGNNGFTDTLTVLMPEDDAATANWGNGWRMPTYTELRELKDNCAFTWTTQNGVNGSLFTASNGNSLFLPAVGYRSFGSLHCCGDRGYYWSSSLYTDSPLAAWEFFFNYISSTMNDGDRMFGFSVRPVCSVSQK